MRPRPRSSPRGSAGRISANPRRLADGSERLCGPSVFASPVKCASSPCRSTMHSARRAEPSAVNIPDLDLQHLLLTAIETLPDSDRTVIALRYMSDFSYQEMCEFLEIPLSTVKKRLHEARRRLRASLTASTGERRTRQVLRRGRAVAGSTTGGADHAAHRLSRPGRAW